MRLLLVNPNTSGALTERLAERARAIAGPDVDLVAATGGFGARYIASRAAAAVAAHAALDALAEHGAGCDAVCLACFGDPGLLAMKEMSPVPVVGMAEASCHAAAMVGRRFSIVTGGALWRPMLTEFVASLGMTERLAGIRTVAPTGGDIARNPDASLASLAEACDACAAEEGADVVILGGAGLAGFAERLAGRVRAPLICSVEAAVAMTVALARLNGARHGSAAIAAPVETVALTPALARAFDQGALPQAAPTRHPD